MITIKILNSSGNPLPAYATPGSSGMDVRANLQEMLELEPLGRALIPTGLQVEIPIGYEIQVRPRSGLALKNGITCLNTPGTIDSDYRGEIKVLLINLSNEKQSIAHGDRIAQLVIMKIEAGELVETVNLENTTRQAGGFGHSGIK